jgi:hypothetical protein
LIEPNVKPSDCNTFPRIVLRKSRAHLLPRPKNSFSGEKT